MKRKVVVSVKAGSMMMLQIQMSAMVALVLSGRLENLDDAVTNPWWAACQGKVKVYSRVVDEPMLLVHPSSVISMVDQLRDSKQLRPRER